MKFRPTILAILSALLLAGVSARAIAGEIVERIVAVVGNEVVLLSDLESALDALVAVNRAGFDAQAKAAGLDESERDAWIRKQLAGQAPQILEQLIRDKVVLARAKTLGITVTESMIDAQIDSIAESQGVTRDKIKTQLASQGYSWEEYRGELRQGILQSEVQRRVARGVQVTEADERALFNQEYASGGPAEVHLRLLFLRGDTPEKMKAARKKATALLKEIRGGAEFAKVAAKHTEGPAANLGGDVGFLKKGQMIPEVEVSAFKLKDGEVSEPIKTAQGMFLIQVVERRGGSEVSFEDVREQLRERIFGERARKAFNAWLAEQEQQLHIERKL